MEFIDTAEALTAFCDAIKDSDWIALDTEFIREKTYYPRLCLIQIGIPERAACIDPLALQSLDPVYDLLMDPSITKVLHACSQDLEIFVHQKGEVPGPIFDTQLAAPLLGLAEQIGYGNAVRELLGVQLDKAQSRTDWSKRPLSSAQLEYAADDVRYLAKMYPLMREKLADLGRLDWLDAEFEPYGRLERYQLQPENAWRRIRGLEKLKPGALSVVQKVTAWREMRARERDLPRNWIIKDEMVFDIARLAPVNMAELGNIRGLQSKTVDRYGQLLIDMVQQAQTEDPLPLPKRSRGVKASVQEEALTDILSAQLRLLSDAQGINSATVANRKELLALVRDEESVLMKGWRKKLAGEELMALRDGQRKVSVENSRVEISGTD